MTARRHAFGMVEYLFVRVPVQYERGALSSAAYEREVHAHAERGWRLVQIFVENPAAAVTEHVLIFERPRS